MEATYTPANTKLPVDFDFFNQNITLFMPNGTEATLFTIPVSFFDGWKSDTQKQCIVYGSQIGASLIMFMMVAVTTKKLKRLQPIFWLNMLSLVLAFLRAMFLAMFYFSPFQEIYPVVSGDYSRVPRSQYHQSVWSSVVTLLLLCTIQASLVLQTNVVCVTMAPKWRLLVVFFSVVVVLVSGVSRMVLTVVNSKAILNSTYEFDARLLTRLNLITEVATIWYFCAIFVGKLLWTMYVRKRMGLKQWGPMQIICISGGCTLAIPSIIALLDCIPSNAFPYIGSIPLTVTAIFLPLSSVWASTSVSDNNSPLQMKEPRLPFGSHDNSSGGHAMTGASSNIATMDSRRNLMDSVVSAYDRKNSRCSGKSTFGTNSTAVESTDDHDIEAQRHSNAFFGVTRFGQKGQSTTMVRKGSDTHMADQDIEMQDGVRIERVIEVQRGTAAPGTADGGEGVQAKARKYHQNLSV